MNYEVVNLEEKIVVGSSIITTNKAGKAIRDIGQMWQDFIYNNKYAEIENLIDGRGIGLYTDYEGDATKPYRFMCCLEVSKYSNANFEVRKIEQGKYAKFVIKGDLVTEVGKAWNEIWKMDLKRKYLSDFEVYNNETNDMNNQTVEIYISIE